LKYKYGGASNARLLRADRKLQFIFNSAINLGLIDISIIETHRGKSRQDRYFKLGKTILMWPNSSHNFTPSRAVDAVPYINGKASFSPKHCIFLAGIICGLGAFFGTKIRWGGNWDQDGEIITDQSFQDLTHYELAR